VAEADDVLALLVLLMLLVLDQVEEWVEVVEGVLDEDCVDEDEEDSGDHVLVELVLCVEDFVVVDGGGGGVQVVLGCQVVVGVVW